MKFVQESDFSIKSLVHVLDKGHSPSTLSLYSPSFSLNYLTFNNNNSQAKDHTLTLMNYFHIPHASFGIESFEEDETRLWRKLIQKQFKKYST